jgi:hypothetical protein
MLSVPADFLVGFGRLARDSFPAAVGRVEVEIMEGLLKGIKASLEIPDRVAQSVSLDVRDVIIRTGA